MKFAFTVSGNIVELKAEKFNLFDELSDFFCSRRKMTRTLSILINYIIVIGGTIWIVIYLLPEIRDSVMAFASNISGYSANLNGRIRHIFDQIPFIDSSDVNSVINRILEPLQHASQNAPQILETLAANVYSFGRITLNFVMAIFIAFYMLFDKERFAKKAKKGIQKIRHDQSDDYRAKQKKHLAQPFIDCGQMNKQDYQ